MNQNPTLKQERTMKMKLNKHVLLTAIACTAGLTLAAGSAQGDIILAQYTLNTTDELTATSVAANMSASAFGITQSEDPNGGTLDNDTYQFTADGLTINRSNATDGWGHGANLAAPFSFTISADGGVDIQVDSVTIVTRSNTHNLAVRFGTSNTSDEYTAAHTFGTGGGTDTRVLSSPFIITAGNSKTFYIDLNSANTNSTHDFGTFTVNGVPEPGSLALMGLGGLLIARRRRG